MIFDLIVNMSGKIPKDFTGIVKIYIENFSRYKIIYYNKGKVHREDGPAVMVYTYDNDGKKEIAEYKYSLWYLKGRSVNKNEVFKVMPCKVQKKILLHLDKWVDGNWDPFELGFDK